MKNVEQVKIYWKWGFEVSPLFVASRYSVEEEGADYHWLELSEKEIENNLNDSELKMLKEDEGSVYCTNRNNPMNTFITRYYNIVAPSYLPGWRTFRPDEEYTHRYSVEYFIPWEQPEEAEFIAKNTSDAIKLAKENTPNGATEIQITNELCDLTVLEL